MVVLGNRALAFDAFGTIEQLHLTVRPIPEPGPRQVRVRVIVAGLNPVDWQIIESPALAAHFGVSAPGGFGNDFSGVIDAVGSQVTSWRVGQRVFGGARARAAADFFLAAADDPRLHPTPSRLSDLSAGVLDIAGRTASAVIDTLAPGEGDTVLIGAAAGGVGTIATQLAVATGARVLGAGSPSSARAISALGAEPVRYGSDLIADVSARAPNGITAAADLHGLDLAMDALRLGAGPGRVVTIEADEVPPGVGMVNGADARGSALEEIAELIVAGRLRLPVEEVYPLEDFRAAISRQRERHTHGKLALVLAPPHAAG